MRKKQKKQTIVLEKTEEKRGEKKEIAERERKIKRREEILANQNAKKEKGSPFFSKKAD